MRYLLFLCFLGSILNGCFRIDDDVEVEMTREGGRMFEVDTMGGEELMGGEEPITAEDLMIAISWVNIPVGSFMMGSNTYPVEQPIHQVTVQGFQMSETEVTVGQYRQCVEAGRCSEPDIGDDCTWSSSPNDQEDYPINCVDWGQARTFAVSVGGDLPTEAQWEYAARGDEDYEYAGSDNFDEVAWYNGNSQNSVQPVQIKTANGYSLYDMSGNVSEWTLDEWHGNYQGAPSQAETPWGDLSSCIQVCDVGSSERVIRGGSWYDSPDYLRVGDRFEFNSDYRDNRLGFRVSKTLP